MVIPYLKVDLRVKMKYILKYSQPRNTSVCTRVIHKRSKRKHSEKEHVDYVTSYIN